MFCMLVSVCKVARDKLRLRKYSLAQGLEIEKYVFRNFHFLFFLISVASLVYSWGSISNGTHPIFLTFYEHRGHVCLSQSQNQNQKSLLVQRHIDNTTPGGWDLNDNTTPGGWGWTKGD